MAVAQYAHQFKKGDSVQFKNKMYRVQDDKGWLHIYPVVNGKRIKMGIEKLFFEPGTEADWAINGWWQLYPDYKLYQSFVSAEMAWIKIS